MDGGVVPVEVLVFSAYCVYSVFFWDIGVLKASNV